MNNIINEISEILYKTCKDNGKSFDKNSHNKRITKDQIYLLAKAVSDFLSYPNYKEIELIILKFIKYADYYYNDNDISCAEEIYKNIIITNLNKDSNKRGWAAAIDSGLFDFKTK